MGSLLQLDFSILNFIQEYIASPLCDTLFEAVTHLGDGGYFWIGIALVSLIFKKTRKMGICILLGLIIGSLICNVTLKPLVARPRPYTYPDAWLTVNDLLIAKPGDHSFPSGHTTSCFAAAMAILLHNKKWGIPAFVVAVLVAFSRLYLYVHFPSDVLAGVVIGLVSGLAACMIADHINKLIMHAKKST